MTSCINVSKADILDNPGKLSENIRLLIEFEAFEDIKSEIEWELLFVESDGLEENDQHLDTVVIGPIKAGCHKFVYEAPPPKLTSAEDLYDVTLLILNVKYRGSCFLQITWFVNHNYTDPELIENRPDVPILDKMERNISNDDIRITTFPGKWDEDDMTEAVSKLAADGDSLKLNSQPIEENSQSVDESMETQFSKAASLVDEGDSEKMSQDLDNAAIKTTAEKENVV